MKNRFPGYKFTHGMKLEFDADGYSIDIEPDDIDVTDTVTVVWEIRGE